MTAVTAEAVCVCVCGGGEGGCETLFLLFPLCFSFRTVIIIINQNLRIVFITMLHHQFVCS